MSEQAYLDLKQYILLNLIGNGTLSDVYRINKKNSNELYAAKIISRATDQNLTTVTKDFQSKFNLLSKLTYASIHKLVGLSPVNFKKENQPVIISELLGNGSLKEIIDIDRRSSSDVYLTETRKLIIIYGIASAMSFLHSLNITHKDLKPSNILMDDYLCPHITDIELTNFYHPNPKKLNNTVYLSPEVLEKSQYSNASDVYAFAFIVYELMTNEDPCKNQEPEIIKRKVLNEWRPKLTFKIPKSYRNLIERCWSVSSLKRPSFDQIVKELKEDPGFITKNVEKEDYQDYINYVDRYSSILKMSNREVKIDEFIKRDSKTLKKVEIHPGRYKMNAKEKEIIEQQEIEDLYDIGYKLYSANKRLSLEKFKEAADKGHVESMFFYANMLRKGEGTDVNQKEAVKYFKMAADKGKPEAMLNYALMKSRGIGCSVNKEEATKYFKKGAEKGHVGSMQNYAYNLIKGEGTPVNKKEAAFYYKKAADKGNVESIYNYAFMLFKGDGIQQNKNEALKYYKKAIDKGVVSAMLNYAIIMYQGDGVPANKKEAAENFKKAADNGHKISMLYYAVMCQFGEGIDVNKKEAEKYYKMAIENGITRAMYNYAKMLFDGDGIQQNKKEAALLFQKAADKDHVGSMVNYAMMLFKGEGIPQNKKDAAFYFKKAADNGDVVSMFYYALMLYKGDGIKQNKKQSSEYYKKAADKEHVVSMFNYALMLYKGDSIPSDKEKAAFYFKKAADKGDIDAMYSYYLMLKKKEVQSEDKNEAARYFKLAVEKGFKKSKVEDLSELFSMEDKGQIKFKLDQAEGILYDNDDVMNNLPYKGMIEPSSSISILVDDDKFIQADTDIECDDNLKFEEYPNDIKEEILQIRRQLDLDSYKRNVKIKYISKNNIDDIDAQNYINKIDDESDDLDDIFIDNEIEKEVEIADVTKIPKSSKIVRKPPPRSQLYLLTHDHLKIPEVTKVEEARKYTETDEAAELIASFNNEILKQSRYRAEMAKNRNSELDSKFEDPLITFRSKYRGKKQDKS